MSFDINELNPYIRLATKSIISAGDELKRRIIFDYELIYIEDGSFTLTYNEQKYKCSKGDFVFLRPAIPHSFSNIKQNLSQPHIHFDMSYSVNSIKTPICFKDITEMTEKEKALIQKDVFKAYPKTPFVKFCDKKKALSVFYQIVSETRDRGLEKKAKLIELIDMLIFDNFAELFVNSPKEYSIAHQIKDYIDSRRGITLGLTELEKQFAYSKFYLERQFKKEFGIGLISYRNSKRFEYAKQVLREESVSSATEILGFSSIYVFSRAFKE